VSDYIYDPSTYRSPQRVWDEVKRQYLDLWIYQHYFSVLTPQGELIKIMPPFEYDKGSIPPIAQNWTRRDDKQGVIPFLVHDWLYENQKIEGRWITRKEADEILYSLLRQEGMRWSKAKAIYFAVRIGGWTFYNERAKAMGNIHYIKTDNG